jgi:iron complex transport system ATP-binding protein
MRLDVQDLAFGYPGKEVGHGVTFGLAGGEVLCLLGPNGGGKTTLFKTILRLLAPRQGRVAVDGEPVAGWSRGRLARVFGYVPQAQLGLPFTVAEIVLMGRTAHIGPFATPSRAIARSRKRCWRCSASITWPRSLHRDQRRRAAAHADRAGAPSSQRSWSWTSPPRASTSATRCGCSARSSTSARGMAIMLDARPGPRVLCAHRVRAAHQGRLARLGPPTR